MKWLRACVSKLNWRPAIRFEVQADVSARHPGCIPFPISSAMDFLSRVQPVETVQHHAHGDEIEELEGQKVCDT